MRRRTVAGLAVGILALAALLVVPWPRPRDEPRPDPRPPLPLDARTVAPEPREPATAASAPGAPAESSGPGEPPPAPAAPPAEPRVVVAGRVVGPGDQPVAGAAVSLFVGEDVATAPEGTLAEILSDLPRVPRPSSVALTDDDGAFRFTLAPAPVASLLASKDGWTPARLERISLRADGEGILLRLAGPAPVSGNVIRMEEGKWIPVAGATVILCGFTEERSPSIRRVLARAETGEDGAFSLQGAPPGLFTLVVLAKGMKPVLLDDVMAPRRDLSVRMQPAPVRSLRGVVLLPDGTTPAARVKVTVRTRPVARPAEAIQVATTDGDGRFAFDAVEWSESCPLHAEFEGRALGYAVLVRSPWPGDSDETVTLEAAPAETLRGVALEEKPDGTRLPVAGLRLRASFVWESRAGKLPREVFDTTAKDGSFEFRGLLDREIAVAPVDPAATWVVNVPIRGLVPWKPATGAWEVEIFLVPNLGGARFGEVTVAGRVVGPDGTAVAGARVSGFGPPAITDREGRFLLRGLVPVSGPRVGVPVSIRASADGFQATRSEDLFLLVGSDPTGLVIPFTGTVLPVRGRVVDEEGRPLAGVQVDLPRMGIAFTAPDGWWRAEGIPGTVSKATVSKPGYAAVVLQEVQVGETVETVVLVRK